MPTHGSLTKAGKVRSNTPVVKPTSGNRSSKAPIRRNRKTFKMRYTKKRKVGQYYGETR